MISYSALLKRPAMFQRFTGLTIPEYEALRDKYQSVHLERIQTIKEATTRKRKYGGGRKPKSLKTLDDQLIFILVYVRIYPLQVIQGFLFDISEARANIWIHHLLSLLEKALGYAHALPKRGKTWDEIIVAYPELRELGFLGDGVERPVVRPKQDAKQRERFSGKKKRHTVKNVLLSHPKNRRVVYLSGTVDGKHHDKKILDEALPTAPTIGKGPPGTERKEPICLGLDLGFQGYKKAGFRVVLPNKKPRGGELTETQKGENKVLAGIRVKIEHAISGVKINRSVADINRNTKEGVDDVFMNIACGLHNLRVAHRYIEVE